jgi:hypothetical protein
LVFFVVPLDCRSDPGHILIRAGLSDDGPGFGLGDRAALLDLHHVTNLVLVGLIMGVVALGARDELLVERVHDAALDQDRDGLVGLVAHHDTLQHTTRHLSLLPGRSRLFAQNRLHARDVAAHLTDAGGVLELTARLLKAQVELFLFELQEQVLQLVDILRLNLDALHGFSLLHLGG